MEIIVRSRFRSIIASNETAKRERRRRIKCAPETRQPSSGTRSQPAITHTYVFTTPSCQRARAVLAHFYCRKPNWSARVYYHYHCYYPSSSSSLLLSFFPTLSSRVYFANPPTTPTRLGSNPGFHATLATPYRVLNTNRDASFSRVSRRLSRTRSLPLMKKKRTNGPLLGLSLLPFRSSGEPLEEPLVVFPFSPPFFLPLSSPSRIIQSTRRRDEGTRGKEKFRGRS